MEKRSNEGIPCTYCDADALPGTNPPVCEEHLHTKTASDEPKTLKELNAQDE
jgi:hypothetical protein